LAALLAALSIPQPAEGQPRALVLKSGGIEFPDGSVQSTASSPGVCTSQTALPLTENDANFFFILPWFWEHPLRAAAGGRDTFLNVAYIGPGYVTVHLFLFQVNGYPLKSATDTNVCAPCEFQLMAPDGGMVGSIGIQVDLQYLIELAGGFLDELPGVAFLRVVNGTGAYRQTAVVAEVVSACGS
jgi:hypothetical protein